MEKYYYQQGRCKVNHYLSLNPVIYEQTAEKDKYRKVKMDCECIRKGDCNAEYTCQLLLDAPEIVTDNGINLLKDKLRVEKK